MIVRRRPSTMTAAALLAVAALAAGACGDEGDDAAEDRVTTTAAATTGTYDEALAAEVVAHYADGVYHSYDASLAAARDLATAVDAFVAAPTEATLGAARTA